MLVYPTKKDVIVIVNTDEQLKEFSCMFQKHTTFLKRMWATMNIHVRNSEKKETSKAKTAFPKTSLVHLIQSANYKVFLK